MTHSVAFVVGDRMRTRKVIVTSVRTMHRDGRSFSEQSRVVPPRSLVTFLGRHGVEALLRLDDGTEARVWISRDAMGEHFEAADEPE